MQRILACLVLFASLDRLVAQGVDPFVPADRVAIRVMQNLAAVEVAPGVRARTVVGSTGSFSLVDFSPGGAAPLHHHTREQANLGLAGTFEVTLGDHVVTLGVGEGFVIPANVSHAIANKRQEVMTLLEFHTVRRLDAVPPRPLMAFPKSAEPVALPDARKLVRRLDGTGASNSSESTIDGQTCVLAVRRLASGAAPMDLHPRRTGAEVYVYVLRGQAELMSTGTVHRLEPGTLVVIPAAELHVMVKAIGSTDTALAAFSPAPPPTP
jgi:quercetin dioxygenase-like cupin family protein